MNARNGLLKLKIRETLKYKRLLSSFDQITFRMMNKIRYILIKCKSIDLLSFFSQFVLTITIEIH